MHYPLVFEPILKERVWGGDRLQKLYGKAVPEGAPIGESWEITDRPEGVSVVSNGALAGTTLRSLMASRQEELIGSGATVGGRFPLLVKILDAREKLSLQVHPPAGLAAELGGEPKTEMWYVTEANEGAALYAGLRSGTGSDEFRRRVGEGTVESCFHRIDVRAGDGMFLPSGRVHAIGAGNVIFEIQQNSDTTYRVFDWNRVGLDGRPRQLHIEESLRSIDFSDFEPGLIVPSTIAQGDGMTVRTLVQDSLFTVEVWEAEEGGVGSMEGRGTCAILGLVSGRVRLAGRDGAVELQPGGFALVPACVEKAQFCAERPSRFLVAWPGCS